ncbi:MAG: hypothetical protein KF686_17125 [Ramlibacter sp.]|nr:hypothetical protein [Ramlibacter sp.]
MGIEFIRERSKPHQKAQSREYLRAADDLLVSANPPRRRSITFFAKIEGDVSQTVERLTPGTELVLQADGDHLNCYLNGRLVATVNNPMPSWLAAVHEQEEATCAAHVEERHRDAGLISVRVTV